MQYTNKYSSPLGGMLLASDGNSLTGLWFENQKYFALSLDKEHSEKSLPVFDAAKKWLGIYFSGREPDFSVPVNPKGTDFQKAVWEILLAIPYGSTVTYGEIAARLAEKRGVPRISPQAVGGAVGHNPISVIIPCHRVVGANGDLTGYAGGIDKKIALLKSENAFKSGFFFLSS